MSIMSTQIIQKHSILPHFIKQGKKSLQKLLLILHKGETKKSDSFRKQENDILYSSKGTIVPTAKLSFPFSDQAYSYLFPDKMIEKLRFLIYHFNTFSTSD